MKTLTLANGKTYSVLDESNSANFRIPVETFAAADAIAVDFTRENMTEIELGNEVFHQVNPISISVNTEDGQKICTVFCQSSLQDYVDNQIDNVIEQMIAEGVID